jgi:hypothetical protein
MGRRKRNGHPAPRPHRKRKTKQRNRSSARRTDSQQEKKTEKKKPPQIMMSSCMPMKPAVPSAPCHSSQSVVLQMNMGQPDQASQFPSSCTPLPARPSRSYTSSNPALPPESMHFCAKSKMTRPVLHVLLPCLVVLLRRAAPCLCPSRVQASTVLLDS